MTKSRCPSQPGSPKKGEPPLVTLTGPRPPGGVEVTGGTVRIRFVDRAATMTTEVSDPPPPPATSPWSPSAGDPTELRTSRSLEARPSFASRAGKESTMSKPEPGNATAFGPVLSAYTRAQAIEDGFLVDVSETAREAGFTIPVAVTRSAWNRLVALPEET